MTLRIAIDASRAETARGAGVEHYARRLIQELIALNDAQRQPYRLSLYLRAHPPAGLLPDSPNCRKVVIPFPRLWTQLRFAAALWRERPSIVFVPAHTLPFVFPGASLVTVHDLGYRHFPAAHPPGQRAYLDWTTRFSQARARVVLADSQATAADLRRFYGTPADKIRVVYPAVDHLSQRPAPDEIAAVRAKHSLPRRYFLFVGTLQPRKNIARIAQAFARWQSESGDAETALVLAGGKGWLFDESWLRDARNLRLTGYFDEADKDALLAGAIALVFPSLHEGFGFPALEAMRCGTPVIASNRSSLPEIVGDAGLLVDPLSVAEIAAAMRRVEADERLRRTLIEGGLRQAKRFRWSETARGVLEAFAEVARGLPKSREPI